MQSVHHENHEDPTVLGRKMSWGSCSIRTPRQKGQAGVEAPSLKDSAGDGAGVGARTGSISLTGLWWTLHTPFWLWAFQAILLTTCPPACRRKCPGVGVPGSCPHHGSSVWNKCLPAGKGRTFPPVAWQPKPNTSSAGMNHSSLRAQQGGLGPGGWA